MNLRTIQLFTISEIYGSLKYIRIVSTKTIEYQYCVHVNDGEKYLRVLVSLECFHYRKIILGILIFSVRDVQSIRQCCMS